MFQGYLTSLNMKAFSYIDLDGVVTGLALFFLLNSCIFCRPHCQHDDYPRPPGGSAFKVAASPLMYSLIQSTLKEVKPCWDI